MCRFFLLSAHAILSKKKFYFEKSVCLPLWDSLCTSQRYLFSTSLAAVCRKLANPRGDFFVHMPTAKKNYTTNNIHVCESRTVILLLTSAASAPWRPSHAGAGHASLEVLPKAMKFGGCSWGGGRSLEPLFQRPPSRSEPKAPWRGGGGRGGTTPAVSGRNEKRKKYMTCNTHLQVCTL